MVSKGVHVAVWQHVAKSLMYAASSFVVEESSARSQAEPKQYEADGSENGTTNEDIGI